MTDWEVALKEVRSDSAPKVQMFTLFLQWHTL
jgi:hypothetical protein